MADFIWNKFDEKTYEEYKKKVREVSIEAKNGKRVCVELYIGSIHVGEICVDVKFSYAEELREDYSLEEDYSLGEDSRPKKVIPLFDCDIYVANVDTGYGYSRVTGVPYDYVGGMGFKDIPCMEFESYQDFKKVISEVLTDMIELLAKHYNDKNLVEAMENPYVDF